MELTTDLCGFAEDSIEPCRTCGIYFTIGLDMDQELVKPLFNTGDDVAAAAPPADMDEIMEQMTAWNLQVALDDGRPQYMCIGCLGEFRRLLKFKRSCLETQEQYVELELQREHNGVVIKREIDAEPDEKFCGYVYLDISDEEEEISDEDGSRRVCAAFDIPHVPIKEEHMARVPMQTKATFQPPEPKELGPPPIESNFEGIKNDELTANMFSASSADVSTLNDRDNEDQGDEDEEEEGLIKFTYDDDGEAAGALPQPIYLPPIVSCKLCPHDSPNEEAHLEHMQRTHLLKDWECRICAKKFTNVPESRLKFHMKWHKLQRHLKCPMCGFFCSSKETLKEHKKVAHTRTKCSYCDKNIRTNLLQRHLSKHVEEREAELANQLSLLQQPQVDAPSPSGISTSTTAFEEVLPPESPPPDSSATSAAIEYATKEGDPVMEHPAIVDYPAPAPITAICVIQCAFCSDTFDDAEQLEAHVLATHKRPRKRLHSPDKTPPPVQPPKVSKPETMPPMEISATEDDISRVSEVSLNGSPMNSSSDKKDQQEHSKTYSPCPLCDKTFDLKFKLNRHLKQHKKAPF